MITYLLFAKIQQKYSSNLNCERKIHTISKKEREGGKGKEKGEREKTGKERKRVIRK